MIDTHAHLDMPEFTTDLAAVISRAQVAGVRYIFTVGTDPASCRKAIEIAERYPEVFAIIGVHPHSAAAVDIRGLEEIKAMAVHPKVKGWGETGLDFYRNLSPTHIQMERFRQQIALAKELRLPLVIHSRGAIKETVTCLEEEGGMDVGGVLHCFSGDLDDAYRYIEMGFLISIPGVITFPKAERLRGVVKGLPVDTFILETDAPFLAPVPYRGRRNEPAYVRYTATAVAELRGTDLSQVAAITTVNASRLFRVVV